MSPSIVLQNTTTLQQYGLVINGPSKRLPPGSYRVLTLTQNPRKYHLHGLFAVVWDNGLELVETIPLEQYFPFNPINPNFVVVGSEPPDGEEVIVDIHRSYTPN